MDFGHEESLDEDLFNKGVLLINVAEADHDVGKGCDEVL